MATTAELETRVPVCDPPLPMEKGANDAPTHPKKELQDLEFTDMQPEDVEAVVDFMAEHFFPREPLSTGLHMTIEDNREWIYDSVKSWLRSGASVVARERETGAIAGTLLGTILTKNNNTSFDDALNSPRAKVKTLHTVLSVLEASVDFFARFSVNKILELAMITVPEKHGGRGVGKRLVQESESRGKALGCQVATAQATAVASQRMLERLGYQSLYEMDYGSFIIAGIKVFDVDKMIGSPSAKVMAKMLTTATPTVSQQVSVGGTSSRQGARVDRRREWMSKGDSIMRGDDVGQNGRETNDPHPS